MVTVEVVNPKRHGKRRRRSANKRRRRKVSAYNKKLGSLMRSKGLTLKQAHSAMHGRSNRRRRKRSNKRRRRKKANRRRRRNKWFNDSAGHARAAKKGWRRRRAKKGKRRRRKRKNPGRRRRRRITVSNPRTWLAGLKRPGKVTVADVGGAIGGGLAGASASGYVKMATGNDGYGVLTNAGVTGLGWAATKYMPVGKKSTRDHVSRGWLIGGAFSTACDGIFSAIRWYMGKGGSTQGLTELDAMSVPDKIKTLVLKGFGEPKDTLGSLMADKGLLKGLTYGNRYGYGGRDATDADLAAEEAELLALQGYVMGLKGNGSMSSAALGAGLE